MFQVGLGLGVGVRLSVQHRTIQLGKKEAMGGEGKASGSGLRFNDTAVSRLGGMVRQEGGGSGFGNMIPMA